MPNSESLNYILAIIAIVSTGIAIWNSLRKPQDVLELKQVASEKDLESKATILAAKETDNKANVLAQQLHWEKDNNDKRFIELGKRLDDAFTLAQNHTHSIDVKVDTLQNIVNAMDKSITKLATIIEERIPINKF